MWNVTEGWTRIHFSKLVITSYEQPCDAAGKCALKGLWLTLQGRCCRPLNHSCILGVQTSMSQPPHNRSRGVRRILVLSFVSVFFSLLLLSYLKHAPKPYRVCHRLSVLHSQALQPSLLLKSNNFPLPIATLILSSLITFSSLQTKPQHPLHCAILLFNLR